jgi:hypothetical protein
MYRKTVGTREKEEFGLSFCGYLFDWEGSFDHFEKFDDEELWVCLKQDVKEDRPDSQIILRLPIVYQEHLRGVKKGEIMRGRGILERVALGNMLLNYAEFVVA